MEAIHIRNLRKTFRVYHKTPGLKGTLLSLFHREYKPIHAIEDISFSIEEGELVGFIGPNGAGKTTTLKCLSGLLFPSSGEVKVLGFTPFDRKKEYLKQIALVMGQKNQLWWDLPAMDSFLLNKEIYQVPDHTFKQIITSLAELLEVNDVLHVQVRKLSLGQRMKCELIASLLHSPKILFLDEPTIGLDVFMQQNLRDFIKEYNKTYNSTIILTSHYMQDVKELCERVIIIDQGKLLYDGKLEDIIKQYATHKYVTLLFSSYVSKEKLTHLVEVEDFTFPRTTLRIPIENSTHIISTLLQDFPIEDVTIQDISLEDIIRDIFSKQH